MQRTQLTFLLSVLVGLGIYFGLDLDTNLRLGLAMLAAIALLWMTETFHITVTALLVPILAVVLGIFSVAEAMKNFANPIIFLFLGGFALAAALHKQSLDERIAGLVLRIAKGRMWLATVLLFATAAFVSMWISNTATTAMMLPLALGMLARLPYEHNQRTYWFLLLGIAYSANIGGIGTLVGSPPNAIAAAAVGIGFADWMKVGVPAVLLMQPTMLGILWWVLRPNLSHTFDLQEKRQTMGLQQWLTLAVFTITVLLWLFSAPVSSSLGIEKGFDAIVALLAIVLLCALKLVSWKDIEQSADWGVLLLFGGGLTLSAILKTTGASVFLAESINQLLDGAPLLLFMLAITAFVVMLTEIASNTASSALLVPIFVSIAQAMGLSPVVLASVIAISASCAFMLPVATPPNAIVFGSGYVPQGQMMRTGIYLNIAMIILIAFAAWSLL
ncbi:solute carrier family 13 (sodium-dependent dicarboxylate transporter), member 2/3/5 [Oceanospirillum multiglobuliferum]|uniref:SLC13 family permease n=1 Tax=Oceanospirillum multiglobuliferum TaxID=64969 RepID=UPI0009CA727F|nr:DASS family sodium-coupled anion symporter [Oceanospirillum multiglobuliferum]SJZ97198.1 solute carrier family 13 (sodium-dependent dicarboxylate transporter), member 2/3/5 [Oceanospirillum multiglobuliferum]